MNPLTESKAEHIFSVVDFFWPIPDDLQPNPTNVVNAAQEVAGLLFELMDDESLPRGQAFCLLVCASKKDKILLFPLGQEVPPPIPSGEKLAPFIVAKEWEPLGIVFGILAVEKKGVMLQTRGFAKKSERTDRLLSGAHTKLALDIKAGKMMRKAG